MAAVARRLGVAPATLRTWDRRYGLGPSNHTSGRHRRYGPQDIARLETMQRALLRGASPAEAARYALAGPASGDQPSPGDRLFAARPGDPDRVSAAADQPPTRTDGAHDHPVLLSGVFESGVGTPANTGGRGLRMPGAGRRARGLGRAVLALDSTTAQQLLAEEVAEHGLISTWENLVQPVSRALTERWEISGAGVEATHLLTECVVAVMVRATPLVTQPRNPRPVLLAGMPEERHSLPLYPLAAVLATRGIATRQFGAALPARALIAAVRRTAPAAVVLWAQLPRHADPDVLDALPRTRQPARVFVGGPGWEHTTAPPSVHRITDLAEAATLVEQAVADDNP
uniref:MerR family transcriptional regulator n=1 Tax=Goodfellowiella coeruleoviolacea TaxID=334858 RepID=UPI0027E0D3BC|nr:MerR family transcriptional regulator [Goodfellowiella coeruleoviolacea]